MGGRKRKSTARAGTAELLGWCQYEGVESNLRLCLIVYFVLLWIKGTSGCTTSTRPRLIYRKIPYIPRARYSKVRAVRVRFSESRTGSASQT
jgi:hypothetical protein